VVIVDELDHLSALSLDRPLVESDAAFLPAWHLLKVSDHLTGAKILVLENALSVRVTKKDDWNSIDENNMLPVHHEVVNSVAFSYLRSACLLWINPFAILHDWVAWRNLEAVFKAAEFLHSAIGHHLDYAPYRCKARRCSELIALFEVLHFFIQSISEFDNAVSSEASAPTMVAVVISSIGIVICARIPSLIIIDLGKLLGILDRGSRLSIESSFSNHL